ncbi:hypothetical protein ACEPAI_8318 [Sanghuangporus weigelae]
MTCTKAKQNRISNLKSKRPPLADKTNATSNALSLSSSSGLDISDKLLERRQQIAGNVHCVSDCALEKMAQHLEKENQLTKNILTNTKKQLEMTRNRLKKYITCYFNGRKALARKARTVEDLKSKYSTLSNSTSQLKSQLANVERENHELRALIDSYVWQVSDANLHYQDIFNRLSVASREHSLMLSTMSLLTVSTSRLQTALQESREMNHRRRTRLARAGKRIIDLEDIIKKVKKFLRLTDKGSYSRDTRILAFWLIELGMPVQHVGKGLDSFVGAITPLLGPDKSKKRRIPSARTVGRIAAKAEIMTKLQLGVDLLNTRSFTAGGDGTSHKKLNYESVSFNLEADSTYQKEGGQDSLRSQKVKKVRFVKVDVTKNHRAETQKENLIDCINEVADIFNRSPLVATDNPPCHPLKEENVAMKFVGSHGDHAEDQKAKHRLLGKWKQELTTRCLGKQYFREKTKGEQDALVEPLREAMMSGERETMNDEEEKEKEKDILTKVFDSLGDEAYNQLPESEKRLVRIWIWTGCGMHKDLNTVKGGDAAMREMWVNKKDAPIPLANKDNAAVLDLLEDREEDPVRAKSAAMLQSHQCETQQHHLQNYVGQDPGCAAVVKRAQSEMKAGGVKHSDLMGTLLYNKDDKKGEQDEFKIYGELRLGHPVRYPDTSNTRYSSYLDAGAETIARRSFYIEYMEYLRDRKAKRTFNNLEENVYKGLLDLPTMTEHAVLALYREAVLISYLAKVRGKGLEQVNALELGPLYKKVLIHVKKLINEPSIILGADADPCQATMNGYEAWDRPDAMAAIRELMPQMPNLEEAFIAFLKGALTTWERFSSEFRDDGTIVALTECERDLAWVPATNDANEGALGAWRVFSRIKSTASMRLFNAIFRFKRNDTTEFRDTVLTGPQWDSFLKKEGRLLMDTRPEKKRRREIYEAYREEVLTKRRKTAEKEARAEETRKWLDGIEIKTDHEILARMSDKELGTQLKKLKLTDNTIVRISRMRRQEKYDAVLKALARLPKPGAAEYVDKIAVEDCQG